MPSESGSTLDRINIRFRLVTGADIPAASYPASLSVGELKSRLAAGWPADQEARQPRARFPPARSPAAVSGGAAHTRTLFASRCPVARGAAAENAVESWNRALLPPPPPPQGIGPAPSEVDIKLISAGRLLDNSLTLREANKAPPGELCTWRAPHGAAPLTWVPAASQRGSRGYSALAERFPDACATPCVPLLLSHYHPAGT